jgi:hypothetical protein
MPILANRAKFAYHPQVSETAAGPAGTRFALAFRGLACLDTIAPPNSARMRMDALFSVKDDEA